MSIFDKIEERNNTSCKGLVYRGVINDYIDAKGNIVFKTILRPLKRKSCAGCKECGWIEETINEDFACECSNGIIGVDKIEDKKLYTIKCVNISRDFETGHIDSWDWTLVPYEED